MRHRTKRKMFLLAPIALYRLSLSALIAYDPKWGYDSCQKLSNDRCTHQNLFTLLQQQQIATVQTTRGIKNKNKIPRLSGV